ncbi:Ger(x)C family spore germination protein [Bacillota bacterium Lsc_1132]
MKKKIILCTLSLLLLTGCWDQRELSSITVVTGIAVDKGDDDQYIMTVEGLNAQELNVKTSSGYAPSIIFSLKGNTLSELSRKMNIGISRNLIYSHMKTLIFSEEAAQEGMLEFFDYLERNREIRDDFNIVIARNNKASDVLKVTYQFQKSTALKLFIQLNSMVKNWGGDPDVKLNNVISAMTSPGRQPVMAGVTILGNPEKGVSVDNMKKVTPDALAVLNSLAVFKKKKLVGFLSITDARNYLWIENNIKRTSVSVPCGENKFFALQIYNSKTRKTARMINGVPLLGVKVQAETYLDADQCMKNLTKVAAYAKYEKLAEKQIQKQIASTIRKAQRKYQSDIFGFGEVLFRQHSQQFKKVKGQWDERFAAASVNIDVKVKIRRTGIRTRGPIEK